MAHIFFRKFVGNKNSPYFCSVFFMVLDLRLTRLVVVRQSIFLCKCKGYRPLALCPLFFQGVCDPMASRKNKKRWRKFVSPSFFVRIAELLQLESGKVGYGQCQFSA